MLSCNISPCQKIKQNFVAANLLLSLFLPFVSTALQDGRSPWNAMVSSRSRCLVRQSVPAFLLFFYEPTLLHIQEMRYFRCRTCQSLNNQRLLYDHYPAGNQVFMNY